MCVPKVSSWCSECGHIYWRLVIIHMLWHQSTYLSDCINPNVLSLFSTVNVLYISTYIFMYKLWCNKCLRTCFCKFYMASFTTAIKLNRSMLWTNCTALNALFPFTTFLCANSCYFYLTICCYWCMELLNHECKHKTFFS